MYKNVIWQSLKIQKIQRITLMRALVSINKILQTVYSAKTPLKKLAYLIEGPI